MNKKLTLIVVSLLIILVLSIFTSGCIKTNEYMIPMRDGIHLATDVYLPKPMRTPHGAILLRTPYNKDGDKILGIVWANQGWPTIIQDVRGRFGSEGNDSVFRNDHTDGPDTLAWIASQSWSNGKIATCGGSALGITQYYMAGANPPNLACQFIQVATPNLYKHAMFHGGEFRKNLVEKWLENQGSTYVLPEIFAHENYTLDFWTNVSLDDNWQDVNVPAIHMGGWYDCFLQGILDGFIGYQHLGGPGAQGKSKLVMGPWTHGGFGSRKQGQLTYPQNAVDNLSGTLFWEMVKEYTMNGPKDFDNRPNVTYYVMGDVTMIDAPGNEWRYADDWPIPASNVSWFFHKDKSLSTVPPGADDPLSYTYDPANPVPTVGGQNLNIPAGPYDQSSVEARADVLVFTSPALVAPYEATGPITARLYVSSDCSDTDFTVKLTDVYPDGRSMLILDGILRMRNRNGVDHWEFMNPGEIYGIDVDLWSTSYIWNTAHKIRVSISSSNYPRFLNNPNTIDPIHQNTTYQIAHNTLYLDSSHPSCIILPEVEAKLPSTSPEKPILKGPTSGQSNTAYTYITSTTDPEETLVHLLFDWGDKTSSGWLGPYVSGETVSIEHTWKQPGQYTIRVKAKDNTGTQSAWSEFNVTIVKGKYNSYIKDLLYMHIQKDQLVEKTFQKFVQDAFRSESRMK